MSVMCAHSTLPGRRAIEQWCDDDAILSSPQKRVAATQAAISKRERAS
jgi:hypothetical protein